MTRGTRRIVGIVLTLIGVACLVTWALTPVVVFTSAPGSTIERLFKAALLTTMGGLIAGLLLGLLFVLWKDLTDESPPDSW